MGQDDLYNYVNNYLQWYFVILQLQDTIHEGDVTRTNIILKTIIFYSHSALSKYFTECIDYILKTEIILPPDAALRVSAATFVNVHCLRESIRLQTCIKKMSEITERLNKRFRGKQD